MVSFLLPPFLPRVKDPPNKKKKKQNKTQKNNEKM
jgi:hypothetical protein